MTGGTSGASKWALLGWRGLLVVALAICCASLPLRAQHGSGHAGGGGFAGGHAGGGGFHGGFNGGGVRSGGFSAATPGRAFGGSTYRGYPAAGRPNFYSAQRFGGPGGLRSPGYAAGFRGAARGPVRTGVARPAFYNRAGAAYAAGRSRYGYGRGYGYRNPYFGFGYRYPYPLFGFGFSPFFYPGLLGYDFLNWDWDTLGWDDAGWNPNVSYNADYGANAASDGSNAGYSGSAGYAQAPAQPYNGQPGYGYGNQALPAPDAEQSRPTPLLPQYESQPYGAPPAREDLTTIVFKDGRPPVRIRNYAMTRTALLISGPGSREIPLDEVDLPATERVNQQAGIDFRLP